VQAIETSEELVVAFFALMRNLRRIVPEEPIDKASLFVLHQLACTEPVRLSDAASSLGLDLSTVSRHVRALQDGGYIQRTEDPSDRRASLLALTAEGRDVFRRSMQVRQAAFDRALEHWSAKDRAALVRLLARLAEDLSPSPAAPEN
jgi:DNA-binding MarR family transcriptional regulator